MNQKLYKHIRQKLKSVRVTRHLTQAQLAKHLKTTPNTVSRWETGTYKPSVEDVWNIAKYFNIHIYEFFPIDVQINI